MTASDWARVETVLDGALDRAPEERAAFLDAACAADAVLRAEVERLLRADADAEADADRFLAHPIGVRSPESDLDAAGAEPLLAPGARVGPYRVVREIGRGGMGVVYLAVRDDGQFEQRVAVKVVAQGGTGLRRRFLAERRFLARLDHPHIARLLDGGLTEAGTPYLVMEYVEGEPITAYAERVGLDLETRLRLFLGVCEAVHHAHQRLIVHRDLKPSNLLVAADGHPKLLDFGVAKLLAGEEDTAAHTRTGAALMTPEYAAPEQVRGEPATTATDTYALGVLLYELLTGQRAHRLSTGSLAEIARVVCDEMPPRPSTAVTRVALPERARTAVARRLRGDLDTIVLRALAKEPARRYGSAEALADDLRRYLDGRPVSARPDTTWYRTSRFVRRHRAAVGAAAAMLVVLVVVTALYTARLAEERDRARAEAIRAERVTGLLTDVFSGADPHSGPRMTARELLDRGAARLGTRLAGEPAVHARLLGALGTIYWNLGASARADTLRREALVLWTRTAGPESAAAAGALVPLVYSAIAHQRHDEAEALLARAHAAFAASRSTGTVAYADLLYTEQELREAQGRSARADSLLRAAIVLYRRNSAPLPLLKALLNLSNDGVEAGRLDEAERLAAEGVRIARRLGDALMEAYALSVLGEAAEMRGALALADARFARAIPLSQTAARGSSPLTHGYLRHRAALRFTMGDLDGAERLLRPLLDTLRAREGPENTRVLASELLLGRVLLARGQGQEAARLITHSADGVARLLPPGDARLRSLLIARAELARAQGDAAAAERFLRSAVALPPPPDQLFTSDLDEARLALGRLLLRKGQAAEAEPLLRAVLAARSPSRGGPAAVAVAEAALAACLHARGRTDEARRLRERSSRVIRALPTGDRRRSNAEADLAMLG